MDFLRNISVRSPWLFRINSGGCNGCDVELATTAFIPRYDVERLGCKYCGSPRHADIVLITGPLTMRVRDKVLRIWNEIPEPKVTVAVGICPISCGVFRGGHSIEGPIDRYLPVDVNVNGCPPRPQAIVESILKAKEIWLARLNDQAPSPARPEVLDRVLSCPAPPVAADLAPFRDGAYTSLADQEAAPPASREGEPYGPAAGTDQEPGHV